MRIFLVLCLLSLSCVSLAAEDARAAEDASDAPGRVARLSLTEGEVSLAPAGTEEWAEAVLNRPLTSGDRLFVDAGGRAELQAGSARVHLDQRTGLSIIELDDDVIRLELSEGTAVVHVLRRRDSERIEVETPNATVALQHPGEYRIEANPAGDRTLVAVRSGGSEVSGEGKSWRVEGGEQGTFTGTGRLDAGIVNLGPRTAFEDWANERNRTRENSESARYVSNEVIGYEDLDRNGRWFHEPAYGYVWQPTYVDAGWAPYRHGRWVWVSPWGWSWVDNSPWGFAPFHYGRWAYVSSRWCWVPGPRHIHPVYAPALVAWTGRPGGVSGLGDVGWFPLGPHEIYVPGYRYSRRYLNDVNVSNTVIVNNTYITNVYNGRHRHFDYLYGHDSHAVTIVDHDHFRGGRNLDGHWRHVDEPDLRRWRRDPRPPALAPNRNSVFAARTLGRIPGGAERAVRDTFSQQDREADRRVRTPRVTRIPFEAEQRAIEANGGRPITRSQLRPGELNNLAAPGRLQRGDGGSGAVAEPERLQNRNETRRLREEALDPRDMARRSDDRPSWSRRERNDAPADNGAAARALELQRQQTDKSRGSDNTRWQERIKRNTQRSVERQVEPQREAPRIQPQPQPQSQPQPRSQPRNERPPREDRGNGRPTFRRQEP